MLSQKVKRLSYSERVIIETLVKEKRTVSYIAEQLNRSVSTISRELKKWRESGFYYSAIFASEFVRITRSYNSRGTKLDKNPKLKMQVYRGLLNGCGFEVPVTFLNSYFYEYYYL